MHGDYKLLGFGDGANHFGELFGILKAVAVAYGNALMLRIDGLRLVLVRNGLNCFLPAAELRENDYLPFFVAAQQRLYVEHRSDHRRYARQSSAAAQMHKVIDREILAQAASIGGKALNKCVHVKSLVSVVGSLHGKQADTESCTHGVKDLDAALGIFIAQLLGCKAAGVKGSAYAGGDAYINNVIAL